VFVWTIAFELRDLWGRRLEIEIWFTLTLSRSGSLVKVIRQRSRSQVENLSCNRRVILTVTQGHRNCQYSIGHIALPISGLSLSSNNVSILLRFRGIITATTVYTWLPVTWRSPSVSTRHLKLAASCTFRFVVIMFIVVNISPNSPTPACLHRRCWHE